ncbi:hypothetical protein [Chitinibacter sp. S2-10]|uniref:hypothetical protein n=1 Tax=Chitinibacter sp. S2-10 TaxID=3373597 RepID=UPI003977CA9E
MATKFLYGQKKYLLPIVDGDKFFRFSDISHYSRLENENMRDDEMRKEFELDKELFSLEINGRKINPESMSINPVFSFPVQHCYCLCLSHKENDLELYDKFRADICLEIDVGILRTVLEGIFSHALNGMEVDPRAVSYYEPTANLDQLSAKDFVFYKPKKFEHEAEFRVALFYPVEKGGFKRDDGAVIPFRSDGESNHLEFGWRSDEYKFPQCVVNVYERPF